MLSMSGAAVQEYQQRALKGEYDRQMDFGKGGGLWVVRPPPVPLARQPQQTRTLCRDADLSPLCTC
jgi:hypothetical protein